MVLSFWLDDFGAGYANYSSLFNHRFTYIKFDKIMFWRMFKKTNGKRLLTAMLSFFRIINIKLLWKEYKVMFIRLSLTPLRTLRFRAFMA